MSAEDEKYLPPKRPPRRSGQQPTAKLTLEAYVRMRRELEDLETRGRDEVAERLLRAREHGDIRENADYDAAKNDQGLMEARIRDLKHTLSDPEILETASGDAVDGGTMVSLKPMDDDDIETYLVAHSSHERAEGVRTITVTSPLGAALFGKHVGDRVAYDAPGGTFTYEIVSIEAWVPN
jgi:transcription elongation factor GreA